MKVVPDSTLIGAEVCDVSLAQVPSANTVERIDELLERHGVLVFRDQQITPGQQASFTRAFGPLGQSPRTDGRVPGEPDIFAVGNVNGRPILFSPREPDGELDWHTDQIHRAVPSRASLLHARIVPFEGGDTLFACMYSAYDALSDDEKRLYDRLIAVHSPCGLRDYLGRQGHAGTEDAVYESEDSEVSWPLVRRHPVTRRKALYFGSHMTVGIVGWSREGSLELVRHLTRHATQPRFQYRHQWRVGDAVFWDNRRVLHAGTYYDLTRHRRLMHRTMLVETAPID